LYLSPNLENIFKIEVFNLIISRNRKTSVYNYQYSKNHSMRHGTEYLLLTQGGDREILNEEIENLSTFSNEKLVELYNAQSRLGIVGVRRQAIYLLALGVVLKKRMGEGPIYYKDNILGLKGKIKYENEIFSNYPFRAATMEELIKAYNETSFNVFEPSISIKIGEENAALSDLLSKFNCVVWAYLTACNPYSELELDEFNERKNNQLKEDLERYLIFEGEAIGADSSWKPEHSFLVLGITKDAAIKLGQRYRQHAIVYGQIGNKAQLIKI
jgi:hypothetical protein